MTAAFSFASAHTGDSRIPRRIAHSTSATTSRWAKTIRVPSTPSGESTRAIVNTTTGPSIQSSWATPAWRPRLRLGAVSAISVHEAGTSAPTARPAIT